MRRLGQNVGGYRGETIDIRGTLQEIVSAAAAHAWRCEALRVAEGVELICLSRGAAGASESLYISGGIHGDEPAGPLAVLRLLRENPWPENLGVWVCPCLNPEGFLRNRREDAAGVDLNRDYLHLQTRIVRAHVEWLSRAPKFSVALCLHEDWESHGFYVYELNPDQAPSLGEDMIRAVTPVCPIDLSETIDGRPASGGIIRPDVSPASRPQWPEAFYLLNHKTRRTYTLEAPSDFALSVRVEALAAAVLAVLGSVSSPSRSNPSSMNVVF